MTSERPIEELVVGALRNAAPTTAPESLVEDVLRDARGTGRRPRWRALATVRPMGRPRAQLVGSPAARMAAVALPVVLASVLTGLALVGGGWPFARDGVVVPPQHSPGPTLTDVPGTTMPSLAPAFVDADGTAWCAGATRQDAIVDTFRDDGLPNWLTRSPRGRPAGYGVIAAAGQDDGRPGGVHLVDPETGDVCLLVELRDVDAVRALQWSPSGDALAIAADDNANVAEVLVWSFGRTSRIERASEQVHAFAWSPDSRKLLLDAAGVDHVVSADGSPRETVTCDGECIGSWAAWSPSGQRLALFGGIGGGSGPGIRSWVYVASTADLAARQLDLQMQVVPLGWRDESTISVIGSLDDADWRVLDVHTESLSPEIRSIFPRPRGMWYLPSPTFERAALVAANLTGDEWEGQGQARVIEILDLTGGGAVVAMDVASPVSAVAWVHTVLWSPDGQRLVYSLFDSAASESLGLWIVDVDGSNLRKLTDQGLALFGGEPSTSSQIVGWQPIWE